MQTTHPYPQLDLARYTAWEKPVAALRFLTAAWTVIHDRRLRPRHTFHLVDRSETPLGISAGDVCYSASENDIQLIGRLVVEFEDRRFYSHPGVDVVGILRAIKSNIAARRVVQGGSTITQQLVRNTLLTPDRSLTRKLLEIVLALIVERHYSKKEILFLYSQFVYVGPGVRGFQAASRLIYRRPLAALDVVSLCGLVGLLRQPTRTYPVQNHDRFRQRQTFLARLYSGHKAAESAPSLYPISMSLPNPILACRLEKPRWTLVTQQVRRAQAIASDDVRKVGLTIDRMLQARVDRLLRSTSRESDLERIAAVVLSNRRGEVLAESAWAHGRECELSPSFTGGVQPGSTFKPFAVLAALEEGYAPDSVLQSAPFESSFIKNAKGSPWRVRNYAFQYRGEVTLTEALRFSDNTAFARLTEILPFAKLRATYQRFGLSERGKPTPAIALGAVHGGVSLIRLASAYSAIARNGVYIEPRFVRFIHYTDGSTWWPQASSENVVVSAYPVVSQLRMILAAALPQLAPLGFVGKTGTTRTGSLVAVYNDAVSVAIWLSHRSSRSELDTKSVSALKVFERLIAEVLLGHGKDPFSI
jgi:penicillin-binding protein 1A